MANCPNCGSDHIQLKKETNVSWGRAVAGWALFGVVGGAVGAITGEDRNVNACLDCGTSWKATELYKTLQIIKNLTGETLNLALEQHRLFMNGFMSEVGPYLKAISNIEKQTEKLIANSQSKMNEEALGGCGFACLTSIVGWTAAAVAASSLGGALLFVLLIPPLLGFGIGKLLYSAKKKSIEKEIEKVKKEAKRKIREAEEDLKLRINVFLEAQSL
jgi:hypothetical protein